MMLKRPALSLMMALFLSTLVLAGLSAIMSELSVGSAFSAARETPASVGAAPFIEESESLVSPELPWDFVQQLNGLISLRSTFSLPHLPLFMVSGLKEDFLRSFAATKYDGESWQVERESAEVYHGQRLLQDISRAFDEEKVVVKTLTKQTSGFLPVSVNIQKLTASIPVLYYPRANSLAVKTPLNSYSFSATLIRQFDEPTLMRAEVMFDEKCLELPATITSRTRKLALELTQGLGSPYQKVKAIEHYLQTNYQLDPEAKRAPPGHEPTDWFLFGERRGREVDFNSALAILARAAGVPARLAFGFSGLKGTPEEQLVYADQAHTWVEVPFKELGWIPFDAIPPGGEGRVAEIPERELKVASELSAKKTLILQITQAPSQLKKGSSFEVRGKVTTQAGQVPLELIPIELFLSKGKNRGGELVGTGEALKGQFSIACKVPQNIQAGMYHLIAHALSTPKYGSSWGDPKVKKVKVVAPTVLRLKLGEKVPVGEEVNIEGELLEKGSLPVSAQEVEVRIEGKSRVLLTNEQGQFKLSWIFPQAGRYTIEASFSGTDFYLPSLCSASITVVSPSFPWWMLAFIPAGGGGAIYFLRRRRPRSRQIPEAGAKKVEIPIVEAPAKTAEADAGIIRLSLHFPGIEEGLPLVWGLGDELTLVFALSDNRGDALPGKALQVYCDGEKLAEGLTNDQGEVSFRQIFKAKGEHLITGVFSQAPIGSIEVVSKLRIVDYREEIVDLFNRFVEWARGRGIPLPPELSPREIQQALSRHLGVKPQTLEPIISFFEEANYSLHPIGRGHYRAVFLALRQVK